MYNLINIKYKMLDLNISDNSFSNYSISQLLCLNNNYLNCIKCIFCNFIAIKNHKISILQDNYNYKSKLLCIKNSILNIFHNYFHLCINHSKGYYIFLFDNFLLNLIHNNNCISNIYFHLRNFSIKNCIFKNFFELN